MNRYAIVASMVMVCLLLLSCTDSDSPNGSDSEIPLSILWSKTFGDDVNGEYAFDVFYNDMGEYVVAANHYYSDSDSFTEGWLFKVNEAQEITNSRLYSFGTDTEFDAIEQTQDGGYIILGTVSSGASSTSQSFLLKINDNLDEEWHALFDLGGMERSGSVLQCDDGEFIFTVPVDVYPSGTSLFVVKTDPTGNPVWTREFPECDDSYYAFIQSADDGQFVVGTSVSNASLNVFEILLMQLSADGDSLWSAYHSILGSAQIDCFERISDGGYLLGGSTCSLAYGSNTAFLMKVDAEGHEVWSQMYSLGLYDHIEAVTETGEGDFLFLDLIWIPVDKSTWLVKTDPLGTVIWQKQIELNMDEQGMCIRPTRRNEYVLAGLCYAPNNTEGDVMLVNLGY